MATPRRDALTRFTDELNHLRTLAGSPPLKDLVALTATLEHPLARSTISDKLAAKSVPGWEFVVSFVTGCRAYADGTGVPLPPGLVDLGRWEAAHWRMLSDLDNASGESRLATAARSQLSRHAPARKTGPTPREAPAADRDTSLAALTGLLDGLPIGDAGTVTISVVGGTASAGRGAVLVCWAREGQRADGLVRGLLEEFRLQIDREPA